jgi:hypothetical protein
VVIAPALVTATALIADGLRLIRGVVLTLSVTGIVSGPLVDPGTESVTVPAQVWGVVRFDVFTPIATWELWPVCTCVVPETGDTLRNPGQLVVLTEAV